MTDWVKDSTGTWVPKGESARVRIKAHARAPRGGSTYEAAQALERAGARLLPAVGGGLGMAAGGAAGLPLGFLGVLSGATIGGTIGGGLGKAAQLAVGPAFGEVPGVGGQPASLAEALQQIEQAAPAQGIAAGVGALAGPAASLAGRGVMAAAMRAGPRLVAEFPGAIGEATSKALIPGALGRLFGVPAKARLLQQQAAATEEAIGRGVTSGTAPWMATAERLARRALDQANEFRSNAGRAPLTAKQRDAIVEDVRKFATDAVTRRSFGAVGSQSGQFTANETRAVKQFADNTVKQLTAASRAGKAVGGAAQSSLEKQVADEARAALHEIPGMKAATKQTQARIGVRRMLAPRQSAGGFSPGFLAYHGGAATVGALGGGLSSHGQDWQRRIVEGALLGQLALSPSSLGTIAMLLANPATRALLTLGPQALPEMMAAH